MIVAVLSLIIQSAIASTSTIAFDSSSSGSASATNVTVSHTTTGANRILLVGIWIQDSGTDKISSVTYNGTNLNQVAKVINGATESTYLYALTNPTLGTHDIIVTKTGSDLMQVGAVSYTGVDQVNAINNTNTNSQTNVSGLTTNVSNGVNDSWTVLQTKHGGAASAGTGSYLRLDQSGNGQHSFYDSNGPKSSGSVSMQTTINSGNDNIAHIIVALSPATSKSKARKSVTETTSSDTTLSDDSELFIDVDANMEYVVRGIIFASSTSAAPDIKLAFTSPTGTVMDIAAIPSTITGLEFIQSSGTATNGIRIPANQPVEIQIDGSIKVGGTAGRLSLQWAQEKSNAATTGVLRGSYLSIDLIE